ncbi:serine/threonine-protein kinase [Demequina sp. SYSU T00192]|uniref:non-specific serine/threonine protein kinase n=1 Tax=Demequina litoralis TaxID=3051660 RepID=A0ABT8G8L9_9MICO|nr:serine/threonine-protein kinase [Demequina sp. SYSU T00192]MDN4475487.1 serine/threonine-protein kinase [Demequina sp. SYSU T00192]
MAGLQREVGDIVGGYRVLGRLGSGGSGSVYKVADQGGHQAALKLVDARQDEVAAARLEREVRALQSLRHPAVPHILDAELDEDETFVVFELVPGETLFDHVQRHGPLAGDALAAFADRTASALEAVHAAGVVHRDVTPSNVMMGPDGPVLIDFGLAHRSDDARLTREGLVSGTPGYVAPEVIDGAEPGTQADRWSWAATVAFAMTGHGPFGSGSGAIGRTLEDDVTLPEVPGAPALRAALGRDVAGRPGMRDVVAALRGATVVMPALPPTAVAPTGLMAEGWEDPDATAVLPSGEQRVPAVPGDDADDAGQHWVERLPWEEEGDEDRTDLDHLDHLDEEGEACPYAPRRRLLLALAALVVVAAAPLAPTLSFLVMAGVAILARGVWRRAVAIQAAEAKRGRRRTSDTVVQTIGLPWHTLRAAAEAVPAILTSAALGIGAGAGAWWLVSSGNVIGASADAQYYGHAAALALGAAVAVIAMAYGPFMSGTRDGAHRMAAAVSPTGGLRAAWTLVALTAILVAAIGVYVQLAPWWWPLPDLALG